MRKDAIGHELPMLYVDPALLPDREFSQREWGHLVDGLFKHFALRGVSYATYNKFTKGQRRKCWEMNRRDENLAWTRQEAAKRMADRCEAVAKKTA